VCLARGKSCAKADMAEERRSTNDRKLVKGLMKAFYWVVIHLFRNWKVCLCIRGYRYTEPTTKTKFLPCKQ
jgi:hypothetical protein